MFLSGCFHATALLGPGMTVATTGNTFQAGFHYGVNSALKNETGKGTLEHLRDTFDNHGQSYKAQ